jgi:hypothetical protein
LRGQANEFIRLGEATKQSRLSFWKPSSGLVLKANAKHSSRPVLSKKAPPRQRDTVECDPSFRMAAILSPLRPLSMMAFQATAEGGDRFRGRH